MAGKSTIVKSADADGGGSNGRGPKPEAAGAPAQAPKTNGRGKAAGSRRAQPTADELGRRAWEATYRNRQKSRRA